MAPFSLVAVDEVEPGAVLLLVVVVVAVVAVLVVTLLAVTLDEGLLLFTLFGDAIFVKKLPMEGWLVNLPFDCTLFFFLEVDDGV